MFSVTNEVEPFLTKYKLDWRMVPFLRNDMIRGFMDRVVKRSVLSEVQSMRLISENHIVYR